MTHQFAVSLARSVITVLLGACLVIHPVLGDTLDDIKSRGKMLVAIDPTFAPYEFTDDQGNITGYDPAILERVAKAMGVAIDYQKMAFTGVIPGLIAGSFDFTATALNVTAERAKRIGYTVPVSKSVNAVLVRGDDSRIQSAELEQLAGLKLGVKANTQPEQMMMQMSEQLEAKGLEPIEILSVDTVEQTVAALTGKRVDFVVDDVSVLGTLIRQRPDENLKVVGELGPTTYIAWGVRKDDKRLKEALDEQIIALKRSGELGELQEKFLGVRFDDLPDRDFIPAE